MNVRNVSAMEMRDGENIQDAAKGDRDEYDNQN